MILISLIYFTVTGTAYFYFNWQFLGFLNVCFEKRRNAFHTISIFLINYALFTVCSFLQLHLIVNWSIFFLFLLVEVHALYRQSLTADLYLALTGAMIGLALNIFFRCFFALILNKPLSMFDNEILMSGNLKGYPILLGFVLSGMVFQFARRKGMGSKLRGLIADHGSLSFLVHLMLILYVYLILNLLTYYTEGNDLVLKLWGIKSALFAMLGLNLGSFYSFRMSSLNRYIEMNRHERDALLKEKKEDEQLRTIAYTDLLTECYNRQYADELLKEVWEEGADFNICFIDLNGLKDVNDQYGHLDGDQYLMTVAETIKDYIRQEDFLFRYGGDEFLILFLEPKEKVPMERMNLINRRLSEYGNNRKFEVNMSISWGVADRAEAEDIPGLLRLADERMYQNKQERHNKRA